MSGGDTGAVEGLDPPTAPLPGPPPPPPTVSSESTVTSESTVSSESTVASESTLTSENGTPEAGPTGTSVPTPSADEPPQGQAPLKPVVYDLTMFHPPQDEAPDAPPSESVSDSSAHGGQPAAADWLRRRFAAVTRPVRRTAQRLRGHGGDPTRRLVVIGLCGALCLVAAVTFIGLLPRADLVRSYPGAHSRKPTGIATEISGGDVAAAGLGLDGGVWLLRRGSAGFIPLGGSGAWAPTLIVHQKRVLVVVGGSDQNLWIRDTSDGGWSPLGPPGTRCFGQAAIVAGGDLHVGCRGEDRALYVGTTGMRTTGLPARIKSWSRLGGGTDYAPAVAVVDGEVTWFVTGRNVAPQDNLYRRGTDGWQRMPVRCAGPPGAGGSGAGGSAGSGSAVYVGCRDASGGLRYATGRFVSFGAVSGKFTGAPGFAVNNDGSATIVVTGLDSALYRRRLDTDVPGESGWTQLGGRFVNGASAAVEP